MTTEEHRRSPPGQRSLTRSFVYVAWPALVVWGLTLVFVARPEGHSDAHFLFFLGVFLAVHAFSVVALVYTVIAALANAPTKVRILACAANLSAAALLLWAPSFRSLITFGPESIARTQCKTLHDKAILWQMIHRKPPDSLEEMVAPLKDGYDENFLESVPEDPWGNQYILERDDNEIRIHSWGEDGQKGTEDDLVYPEDK